MIGLSPHCFRNTGFRADDEEQRSEMALLKIAASSGGGGGYGDSW